MRTKRRVHSFTVALVATCTAVLAVAPGAARGVAAARAAWTPGHGRQLTVPPAPQMFLLGPTGPVKTGSAVTFTVTMQPARRARQPSGRVAFYEDGTKIGSAPLRPRASGRPTASLTTTARSGNHQIVAVYAGDSHYLPATSNTSTVTGH